jgi:hypothetical protein
MSKLKHRIPNFVAGLSLLSLAKKATWPVSHEEHQLQEKNRSAKKAVPDAEAVARKLHGAADKTHHEADEPHHAIH